MVGKTNLKSIGVARLVSRMEVQGEGALNQRIKKVACEHGFDARPGGYQPRSVGYGFPYP